MSNEPKTSMQTPSPDRLREIAEHIYGLGAYTQAHEVSLAADEMEQLQNPGMKSYAPEVIASSGTWAGNALRFKTRQEALDNVANLQSRWLLVTATRVVPSTDPPNYRWSNETGLTPIPEERTAQV